MRSNHKNQGFTLIEIIIGSAIILTALVSLVVAFSNSAKQTQEGTLAMQAPLIAQEIIENYRADPASITCAISAPPTTRTITKNSVDYFASIRITPQALDPSSLALGDAVTCDPLQPPHAYRINTTISWGERTPAQTSNYEQTIHTSATTKPQLDYFESSLDAAGLQDETQTPGAPITLSWGMTYGTQPMSIVLTSSGPDGPTIAENLNATDTITVNPTVSSTYTLTATNSEGSHSLSTSILISNNLTGFTATGHDPNYPNITAPHENTNLAWTLTNNTLHPDLEHLELSITHATGPNPADVTDKAGSHTVVTPDLPANTVITYTLTHYYRTGENRSELTQGDQRTASLQYLARPEFMGSSLSPAEQCAATDGSPRPVTLTWDVRGAPLNGVTIDSPTARPNRGTTSIPTPTSRAYTITATNKAGRTTSTTLNAVIHTLPSITSFTANPTSVLHGTPVTLAWNITNSTARRLSNTPITGPTQGDTINPTGNRQFIPTPTGNHNYTIRAYSTFGCWAERQVTFNVRPINISSFTIQAPTTGSEGTSGDLVTATWSTTEPLNATHQKVVLTASDNSINQNITSSMNGQNGTYTFTLPNKTTSTNVTYRLEIRQVVTGEILNPTTRTTNFRIHPPAQTPAFTIRGITTARRATHGDNLTLQFTIPTNYNPALHTTQYQLPGGNWTALPTSNQLTTTTPAPGTHTYSYRVISKNANRVLGSTTTTITSVPVPTISNLAYNRTEATVGDDLSVTATLSSYDTSLHQLQSRRSGTTTWANALITAPVVAQNPSVIEYRIINSLAGAPSNGRVYATRNTNAPNVYPPPTMDSCTISPAEVAAGDSVTLAWAAPGFRPSLHQVQWHRTAPTTTTPTTVTDSPVSVVTPNLTATGLQTVTYKVSITNRNPGTFQENSATCTVAVHSLGAGSTSLNPNLPFGYLNDTSNLTWSEPSGFNDRVHSYQYRRTSPSATSWISTPNPNYNAQFTSTGNWQYEVRVVSAAEPSRVLLAAERSNTVNVQPSPTFTSFTATPNPVRDKNTITVNWVTQNLGTNHRVETRARTGTGTWSTWTSRGTSSSFTEAAVNTGTANITRSYEARIVRISDSAVIATRPAISITVQPVHPPTATNVKVSVDSICSVASSRTSVFSWTLGAGTTVKSVTANNGAAVSGSGNSRTITVTNSTTNGDNTKTVTATLVVENTAGETRTYTATIARPAAPSISSFTVPATSPFGEAYAISWGVANATTVRLDGTARTGTSYTQPASTSSGNRTHTLTAEKAGCTTATLTRTVNLQQFSGVVCVWQAPPHTSAVGNPCNTGRIVETRPNVNHTQPGAWVEIARYPSNVTHVTLTSFSVRRLCRWGASSNHNPHTNCSTFSIGWRGKETTAAPTGTRIVAADTGQTTWLNNQGVGVNGGCNTAGCGGAVHLQQSVRLITSGSYKVLQARTESHRLYDENWGSRYYGAHGMVFTVTPKTGAVPANQPWTFGVDSRYFSDFDGAHHRYSPITSSIGDLELHWEFLDPAGNLIYTRTFAPVGNNSAIYWKYDDGGDYPSHINVRPILGCPGPWASYSATFRIRVTPPAPYEQKTITKSLQKNQFTSWACQ